MSDTKIFIKTAVVAQDCSFGIGTDAQVRNGVNVNGNKINSDHILYNNPASPYHGKTMSEVITLLIEKTGI